MKIVVLLKDVPDADSEWTLDHETGLVERDAVDSVPDEIGERAVEAAVSYAENHPGTEVVILTMGADRGAGTARRGLAMGADSAVHVVGELLRGADLTLTAETLAAALGRTGYDLIITGVASADGAAGVLPAMLGEALDIAALTALSDFHVEDGAVRGTRLTEELTMTLSASLPAIISVTEAFPEGRLPTFKAILSAKKKPYEILAADELGVIADDPVAARSILLSVERVPGRGAGIVVTDDGDAASRIFEFLRERRLA